MLIPGSYVCLFLEMGKMKEENDLWIILETQVTQLKASEKRVVNSIKAKISVVVCLVNESSSALCSHFNSVEMVG